MYTTARKYLFYLWTAALLFAAASCGWFASDHPQAEKENLRVLLGEHEILNYADSVDAVLGQLDTQQSLIYTLDDYSFFVTKYNSSGKPLLYVKKGESGEYAHIEERYYLNDDKLVLYTKKREQFINDSILMRRDYFRNGVLFYSEIKKGTAAGTEAALIPFHQNPSDAAAPDLKVLEQAISQTGPFNLVFEGIADYPQARYLILSRDEVNAYRAALLLENVDGLAAELTANPEKYKGAKLDLNWKIRDGEEAVYISGKPVRNN